MEKKIGLYIDGKLIVESEGEPIPLPFLKRSFKSITNIPHKTFDTVDIDDVVLKECISFINKLPIEIVYKLFNVTVMDEETLEGLVRESEHPDKCHHWNKKLVNLKENGVMEIQMNIQI